MNRTASAIQHQEVGGRLTQFRYARGKAVLISRDGRPNHLSIFHTDELDHVVLLGQRTVGDLEYCLEQDRYIIPN